MQYIVLKGFQVDGYAALEAGEIGILPYEADKLELLVEQGYLAPVAAEETAAAPVAEPGEPPAETHPHFVGAGEPTPGTWEAVWRDDGAPKSAPSPGE